MQPKKTRGFIAIYAICAMLLVVTLLATMNDTLGSDIEIARLRMYQNMARISADAGVEYGLAVLKTEALRRGDFVVTGEAGGPWTDPGYTTPRPAGGAVCVPANNSTPFFQWMRGGDLPANPPLCADTNRVEQIFEFSAIRTSVRVVSNVSQIVCQSHLMLRGEQIGVPPLPAPQQERFGFSWDNVFDRSANQGNPVVFKFRSRGEVLERFGPLPNDPFRILASAYINQTFIVPFPDIDCSPGGQLLRQVWELDPADTALGKNPDPH